MTKSEAITELVRIWHSPHLDLSLKAGLAEAIDALKGEDGDLISRQGALDAIMGEPTDAHYPSWYAQRIKLLPSAEPKTGEWDICKDYGGVYGVCSICGCYVDFSLYGRPYKVCPHCEARMIVKDGEE